MLHPTSYTKNRQTLLMERSFKDTKSLSEILYEYVCEQILTPSRSDGGESDDADSEKEG